MKKLFKALCYSYLKAMIYRNNYLNIAIPISQKRNCVPLWDTFNKYRLTSNPAWMSNYIHYGVGDNMYPFTVFNDSSDDI